MNGAFDRLDLLASRIRLPDPWQQDAIRALSLGRDVIVSAPTGAGKTHVFETIIRNRLLKPGEQAVYTVPTRALANDKWREWRTAGWRVGIATGDLSEGLDAPVLVATLETQRERLFREEGPRLLVVDEYQMVADERRGLNYELSLALAPRSTQLLLLSGSVANPGDVAAWLERLGREVVVVETRHRPVPLDEVPVAALPEPAPKRVTDFWQRLALGVLLSDYGPLLIFAPQRRSAEKIARKIAEGLPDDDPIECPDSALQRIAGPELTKLLRKRVAYHHSGLGFAQRAGLIEPLAKAGQLRVIVATLGLAAGINFSVRSVFVADTQYQDGPFLREVRPDELLQMFGRAGRRGLDECGYLLAASRSPRLADARPRLLRRSNEIDWPTLLRIMRRAADRGASPFEAARAFCGRLFSEQRVSIGFAHEGGPDSGAPSPNPSPPGKRGLFGLGPVRGEFLNSAGEWEPETPARQGQATLGESWSVEAGRCRPAAGSPAIVSALLPEGTRICRLDRLVPAGGRDAAGRRYGAALTVATQANSSGSGSGSGSGDRYRLTRQVRLWSGLRRDLPDLTREELELLLPEWLASRLGGAAVAGFAFAGSTVTALLDLAGLAGPVIVDSRGRSLWNPPRRSVALETETHYIDESTGRVRGPSAGSPAHAWRQLGLIDDRGVPTDRGVIFSYFQQGEGLAIAAALEDPTYPVGDMIWHFANLRASHRFETSDTASPRANGSERLSTACRRAYGPVDHEGYLRLGLPVGYGEGACEAIEAWKRGGPQGIRQVAAAFEIGPGDIERAYVEWLSLLRHIRGAPDFEHARWRELRRAAGEELERRPADSPLRNLPDLPPSLLGRPPQHRLSLRQIPTRLTK